MDKRRITIDNVPTVAAWLVFALTIIAFALSYDALRHVANEYGKTGWQSWLWPLLIDLALIIFSIAVLRAYLLQETAWRRWALVGLATGATVYFNYIHAGPQVNAKIVAIVPPIVLLFSFETLVGMLRSNARRNQATSNAGPDASELQAELARVKAFANITYNELDETQVRFAAESKRADDLQAEIAVLRESAAAAQAIAAQSQAWGLLSASAKAVWIAEHCNGDRPPAAQLAEALQVNVSTVSRAYKKVDESK